MSRRTSDAHKAILDAWKLETDLIREGKGTRDWTAQQQKDILEKGKAYDDDGVAFQGHHMRSAEKHPECQGDPQNIQFLTRGEHLEAHGGCWQNPTNGYFDPITKLTRDFGDGPVKPCETITLSDPIELPKPIEEPQEKASAKVPEETAQGPPQQAAEKPKTALAKTQPAKPAEKNQRKLVQGMQKGSESLKSVVKAVGDYVESHPAVKAVAAIAITAVLAGGTIFTNRQDETGGNNDGTDIDFNKYSDDTITSGIGAKSDPEPKDNSSCEAGESSGSGYVIDESEYEIQERQIDGGKRKLAAGQKASERARKNAEDAGCELGEDETYHVAYPKGVRCKKKNEE